MTALDDDAREEIITAIQECIMNEDALDDLGDAALLQIAAILLPTLYGDAKDESFLEEDDNG